MILFSKISGLYMRLVIWLHQIEILPNGHFFSSQCSIGSRSRPHQPTIIQTKMIWARHWQTRLELRILKDAGRRESLYIGPGLDRSRLVEGSYIMKDVGKPWAGRVQEFAMSRAIKTDCRRINVWNKVSETKRKWTRRNWGETEKNFWSPSKAKSVLKLDS